MAGIYMDEDNAGIHLQIPRSSRKVLGATTPTKKKVLGKLDNVINNLFSTPLQGNLPAKWPSSCAPKEDAQAVKSIPQAVYIYSADIFDYTDFPSTKCLNNCHKPFEEIWAQQSLDESLVNQLLNKYEFPDESRDEFDMSLYKDAKETESSFDFTEPCLLENSTEDSFELDKLELPEDKFELDKLDLPDDPFLC